MHYWRYALQNGLSLSTVFGYLTWTYAVLVCGALFHWLYLNDIQFLERLIGQQDFFYYNVHLISTKTGTPWVSLARETQPSYGSVYWKEHKQCTNTRRNWTQLRLSLWEKNTNSAPTQRQTEPSYGSSEAIVFFLLSDEILLSNHKAFNSKRLAIEKLIFHQKEQSWCSDW
jgi:hypothetical protein